MTTGEDSQTATMAWRRRELVLLDRSKTLRMIEGDEWGRAKLAETEHRIRSGMTRLETVDWALKQQWQGVLDGCRRVEMPGAVRGVDKLVVAFLPREEAAASCEAFEDGSGLVLVSDALLSLAWRLATFNAVWRGTGSIRARLGRRHTVRSALAAPESILSHPKVQASTASLRYSIQHIRAWGLSAAVALRKESAGGRDGVFASAFVLAHEIGHYVLAHDREPKDGKSVMQREFEADEFALRTLMGMVGVVDRAAVGSAVLVALCALQVWESGALIRDVRSHPHLADRWEALAGLIGAASADAQAHTLAVRTMSGVAASEGSLPQEFWEALRQDGDFEIVKGLPYFLMIEGFDRTDGMPMSRRDELVRTLASASPSFIEGWHLLAEHGWAHAYTQWGIDSTALLDRGRSLSFYQVVNQISAAPAWSQDSVDSFRRTCALIAIHARLDELRAVS